MGRARPLMIDSKYRKGYTLMSKASVHVLLNRRDERISCKEEDMNKPIRGGLW